MSPDESGAGPQDTGISFAARTLDSGDAAAVSDEAVSVYDLEALGVYYGDFLAVRDATIKIRRHEITAFIGPSTG
jgi:phosphate transport system ATP-binding protein